jgi:ferrochelatase
MLSRLPRLFWLTLLNLVILRTRPKKSAELYRKVWTDWGSPLLFHTYAQTGYLRHMAKELGSNVHFDTAMRYGNPVN